MRLDMDSNCVGAGGGESLDPAGRFDDHEVDVDRELGCGADGLDDRETNADVRHEDTVHDVDVDEVGAGRFDVMDLLAEPAEISRQDRRPDCDALSTHLMHPST
jgi:hypothetical protein